MNILITGGFGLVGGRAAKYLQQLGHHIILGSRKESNPPDWLPQGKVAHTDWSQESSLEELCRDVDVVIQAAGVNAQDCSNDPVAALEFNGVATARLHRAASKAGVKRFIYLSTAHVYASSLIGTISENTCPQNIHPYATSHFAGENAILGARQQEKIETVVLRLSNAFGAPMQSKTNCWMLLMNDLCRQAVCQHKLTLRSAGLQRRDFVTLQDVTNAIDHVVNLDTDQVEGKIFNIGGAWTPRVIDMLELVQDRCLTVLGFTPDAIYPKPTKKEVTIDLEFQINKLLSTGFKLSGNVIDEVDEMLLFCQKAFGNH